MTEGELQFVLTNRERAHLRLLAIEQIGGDRIPLAMQTLSQLIEKPEAVTRGTCQFCGCTDEHACAVIVPIAEATPLIEHVIETTHDDYTHDDYFVVRCSWWDEQQTVCSNARCVDKYQRLHREQLLTSAGIVLP